MTDFAGGFVRTYTGHKVQFLTPDPDSMDLNGIAMALARAPRFNGHTLSPWSVAEHSILMSYMAKDARMAMALLLHDAHEGLTGDIPSPLKALIHGETDILKRIESNLNYAISRKLGDVPMQGVNLTEEEDSQIKRLDTGIGWLEARLMLPGFKEKEWEARKTLSDEEMARAVEVITYMIGDREEIGKIELKEPAIWLREKFLRRYNILREKLQDGDLELHEEATEYEIHEPDDFE